MKIVCAWCGADLGEKKPLDDPEVTHGICPECAAKMLEEKPRIRRDWGVDWENVDRLYDERI